jgi:hypothetical protein
MLGSRRKGGCRKHAPHKEIPHKEVIAEVFKSMFGCGSHEQEVASLE